MTIEQFVTKYGTQTASLLILEATQSDDIAMSSMDSELKRNLSELADDLQSMLETETNSPITTTTE